MTRRRLYSFALFGVLAIAVGGSVAQPFQRGGRRMPRRRPRE